MKRQMLLCERVMYVDRHTPFVIVQAARIRGRLDPARLRAALAAVQRRHPMLRCAVIDGERPQFVLETAPEPPPLRLVEREDERHWQRESAHERETAFAVERAPLMRAAWLQGRDAQGEVGELLLSCHHAICDGMSMLILLREVLAVCERPDLALDRLQGCNRLEDILPPQVLADPRLRRSAAWKAALFRLYFAVRRRRPPVPQGRFHVLHWKLPREATAALAERARAEGVTVFAALGVAFAMAFRSVRGPRSHAKIFAPVDIRKFLPRIGADGLFSAAPGAIVALDLRRPPEQIDDAGFWELARRFKARLNQRVERLARNVPEYFIGLERLHGIFDQFIAERRSELDAFDTTLSNVGRIQIRQDYEGFRVETVFSPSVRLPWRSTTAVLSSGYAGELDFAFSCNEASLALADAERVREVAMRLLVERGRAPLPATAAAPAQAAA